MRLMNLGFAHQTAVLLLSVACILANDNAFAEVKTETVNYKDGDVTLTGELTWDDSQPARRPGILVLDEWWGLTEWAKDQARELAAAGYVAFAADMYGDGKTTNDPQTAGKWSKEVTGNRELWLRRAQLGLDILKANSHVDASRTAAMGSSFGGKTAVEMAYAGLDIKAAVCIACSPPPPPEGVTKIKPKLLVFYGGDDLWSTTDKIATVKDGLSGVDADWQIVIYSDTRHSFTNPAADTRGIENIVYNERSSRRAWAVITALFEETFE